MLCYFWDRWPYFVRKLSWDITTTQVNSALHLPESLNRVPVSAGVKTGVTAAGWQVTLCDPIWHVISRSGDVSTNCYIHFTLHNYGRWWTDNQHWTGTGGVTMQSAFHHLTMLQHDTLLHDLLASTANWTTCLMVGNIKWLVLLKTNIIQFNWNNGHDFLMDSLLHWLLNDIQCVLQQ